jgi:hypothetical protein
MPRETKLTEQHYRLLDLYKNNKYSTEQLAEKSGFSESYINDLIVNNPTTGETGKLFAAELRKVDREIEARISWKNNRAREKLVNTLIQWSEHANGDNIDTKTRHKMLVDAINALNKAMPYQVNIENYTWKEGMTAEEAVNEFKRIKGLARAASIRRRVQEFAAAGAEQSLVPDGQIDQGSTDAQDTVLPAQSETESFSRKSLLDQGDIRRE